jgi:hypothetical protein
MENNLNITEKITIFKGFSLAPIIQTVISMSLFGIIMFFATRVSSAYGNSESVTGVVKDVEVLKAESQTIKTQYLLIVEQLDNIKNEIATEKNNSDLIQEQRDKKIDLVIDLVKSLLNGRK